MNRELFSAIAILATLTAFAAGSGHPDAGPQSGTRYATDAYPGFDSESEIVNPSKKEPRWFAFINGPKYDNAADQYDYCKKLVSEERWSKAAKELDALVREWPTTVEAPKAQEALAQIQLEYLDDAEEAFAEYRYLADYYSLSCDYSKIVDKLYQIAGKLRLDGKTIIFFNFKNTVDVRRAYEACVLRAPGASWAPQAMLTIGELREEEERYEQAVKVYENLRNLHYGTPEARKGIARECEVRMQLLRDHGYNRDRARDSMGFFKIALKYCDDADRHQIERDLEYTRALIEEESWKATRFYDSSMRTRRSAISAYERFLAEFPDGVYSNDARDRLVELKGTEQ